MSLPRIATRDEWLVAPKELLAKEKDLTRRRDAAAGPRTGRSAAPARRGPRLQVDNRVFHTYSQYARGLDGGSYHFLDLTALGRQEEWEEPKGRNDLARSATPDFAS